MSVSVLEQPQTPPPSVRPTDLRLTDMPLLGFQNYWYPVMFARNLGRKSIEMSLLGQAILFSRVDGKVSAIQAKCPHRGVALALGSQLVPGVLTCRYHGFSFDLETGECVAALTEGPNAACVGKLRARVYPVQERLGLIWVFIGAGTPPPLEDDLPEEFLANDAVVVGRFSVWKTNWRVSVDNGCDVAHVPFLHRKHPFVRFNRLPAFFKVTAKRQGKWLRVGFQDVGFEGNYPRIGRWPRDLRFRRPSAPTDTSVSLPGLIRIVFQNRYAHMRWSVAVDADHTLIFQALVKPARGLSAFRFKLAYYLWIKWLYHVSFQEDDQEVLASIDRLAPEGLTQSDAIVIQWRRMAREARQPVVQ